MFACALITDPAYTQSSGLYSTQRRPPPPPLPLTSLYGEIATAVLPCPIYSTISSPTSPLTTVASKISSITPSDSTTHRPIGAVSPACVSTVHREKEEKHTIWLAHREWYGPPGPQLCLDALFEMHPSSRSIPCMLQATETYFRTSPWKARRRLLVSFFFDGQPTQFYNNPT